MSNCSFMTHHIIEGTNKNSLCFTSLHCPYNNRIFSSSVVPRVMMSWKINSKFPPVKCSWLTRPFREKLSHTFLGWGPCDSHRLMKSHSSNPTKGFKQFCIPMSIAKAVAFNFLRVFIFSIKTAEWLFWCISMNKILHKASLFSSHCVCPEHYSFFTAIIFHLVQKIWKIGLVLLITEAHEIMWFFYVQNFQMWKPFNFKNIHGFPKSNCTFGSWSSRKLMAEDIMDDKVLLMNLCFVNYKSRFVYVNHSTHLKIVPVCVKYITQSIYRQA